MKNVMSIVSEHSKATKIAAIAVGGVALVAAGGYGIRRFIRSRKEC